MAKLRLGYKNVLVFKCPGCDEHHDVWVQGVYTPASPDHKFPSWDWNNDFDKPTFNPSINVTGVDKVGNPLVCHSFIKDGMIQFLGDCTHELANQTVELPELENVNIIVE